MKISVLMPVYNTKEEFLREAIESILNQTFTDFEFLIINDGSTDERVEQTILSYKDSRIKYFYQGNQGIPKTRNKLMKLAKGKYLALADSDDISINTRFEKEIKILDENPNIGAVSASFEFFPNNIHIQKNPKKPKLIEFLKNCAFAQPAAMLRKEYFDKYNLTYNENYTTASDYELWSRAVRYFDFYNIQEVLLKYRWHGNNISITQTKKQQKNDIKVKKNIISFLTADKQSQESLRAILLPPPPRNPALSKRLKIN